MTTQIEIAVSGRLRSLSEGKAARELAGEVEAEVGRLARRLGLADAVQVGVSASNSGRPLRVLVNGTSTPYPPDLLWQLSMEHSRGLSESQTGSRGSIADDCLTAHCGGGDCAPADVAPLVVSMIRNGPALLVDEAQAAFFAAEAGNKDVSSSALRHLLASLLDLGVTPHRPETVIESLAANGNRREGAVEAAFVALQRPRVEIRVSARYRATMTGANAAEPTLVAESAIEPHASELFVGVEERLLVEWGLIPPDIVWATDHDLPDGRIVVRVNDRLSATYRGLDAGDGLILGDSDDLSSAGRPTKRRIRNPANAALKLAVVDSEVVQEPEGSAGPAAFAALVVYREIIANAYRLISTDQTLFLLQDLERRAPELVRLVLRHFTVAEITQVLRGLARERIPPRLLPVILERFARLIVDPRPPAERAEFVRHGLSSYLVHRFARGGLARTFFELSPEIEAGLSSAAPDEAYAERLRDAVWSTLRKRDVPPVLAAVLVQNAPRQLVFQILAPELPELVVIGRRELGAEFLERPHRIDLAEPVLQAQHVE